MPDHAKSQDICRKIRHSRLRRHQVSHDLVEALIQPGVIGVGHAVLDRNVQEIARHGAQRGTGAERHWRLLATPVLDGSGGVQFLIHHLADRTELAALRETADRLRVLNREQQLLAAFVENSSDFIGISDPEGRPIYVNAAGRRMVGLGPEQPVGETRIPEYYPPELRGFVQDVIVKSMVEQATGEAKPISVIGRAGRPFPSPTSIS